MKKKYVKPEAEYVSLEAEDVISNDFIDGTMSGIKFEDDLGWEV